MNMKLEEEKRKKRFMESRGGSVGEGYTKVNGEWIKDEMEENYCNGLRVEENRRYWKITSTNGSGTQRSVNGFIAKAGDKKFREGDMLKAAGWAAPARNFARGNVLDGYKVDEVRWTGIG